MRNRERRGKIVGQPMAGRLEGLINSGAFTGQPPPLDAIEVQDRRVCRTTRPDRRTGVVLRPVDDFGEIAPERFLLQGSCIRLGAGDDQPVDGQAIDIGDVGILLLNSPLRRLRSLHGGQ